VGGRKGDANLFLDWVTEIDVCVCSMPRRARIAPGEIIYHALNRANGRSQLFDKFEDYAAFERIMVAAMRRSPLRLLAYWLTV
jgi:hypothetical protein